MFSNIALVIDPNYKNEVATAHAIKLAKQMNAEVTLLGVTKSPPSGLKLAIPSEMMRSIESDIAETVNRALEQAKASLASSGVNSPLLSLTGEPFVEIIRAVVSQKFDLVIVMAANNQAGISERFFGSTQMHLLRKCPCPVWIVKPDTPLEIKRILTPIDALTEDKAESEINTGLVKITHSFGTLHQADINFLQVWSLYMEGYLQVRGGLSEQRIEELREQTLREYKRALKRYVDKADWSTLKVKQHFECDNYPSSKIINAVEDKDADLLIMGSLCRTGIEGFLIGNTAEKVLNEVSCSVLALKPSSFVSPVKV